MDYLQFDGISSYVEVPDTPSFSLDMTGAITVAAWLRPDTLTFSACGRAKVNPNASQPADRGR